MDLLCDAHGLIEILMAKPLVEAKNANVLKYRGGGFTFNKVSFAYGGASVLRDVTFSVGPGGFVFLVGPSGAGKTHIAELLSHLRSNKTQLSNKHKLRPIY
jgi:ABC-type multidrug transport system fused ATPase/permease subunit